MCRQIASGSSLNVVEIDAASNNGVENIRDIREQVQYPPTEGRYRVYIIDEVHMLSIGAFNALLKTLEEPPSYVIFKMCIRDRYESIWNEPYFYSCNGTVMVHIRKLRKKVEKDPQNPVCITTVYGKGYRFEV